MGPETLKCEVPCVHDLTKAQCLVAIVETAAKLYSVTPDAVWGSQRTGPVCDARAAAWVELRSRGWSWNRIARMFDRDHTTVLKTLQARNGTRPGRKVA